MKTHWVITVKDPRDREAGLPGYERRFEFDDVERAFACSQGALKAGFGVSSTKVLTTKEQVPA